MTIADWWLNPAGIFHDERGTDWAVVFETAGSWFWPVFLATFLLAVVIHILVSRVRNR